MFPRDTDKQRESIYREQVKTNELLTQLIELLSNTETTKTTVTKPTDISTSKSSATKQNTRGKA